MNEKQSVFERIKFYIIKPSQFFEKYKENPKYLFHLVVISMFSMVTALITKYTNAKATNEIMHTATEGMSFAEIESINTAISIANSPILTIVLTMLGLLIGIYLMSTIYYLIIKGVFKGEGTFSHMVILTLVTSYPVKIMGLVNSFTPQSFDSISLINTLLSYVNIPSLWSLFLIIVGTSVLFEMSIKKSAIIHCILFLIGFAFAFGSYELSNQYIDNVESVQ
ncbi:MAG: YIP1 family protein [Eubacteriaceae bacterium]